MSDTEGVSRFEVTLPMQLDEEAAAAAIAEWIIHKVPKSIRNDVRVRPIPSEFEGTEEKDE